MLILNLVANGGVKWVKHLSAVLMQRNVQHLTKERMQ
jgi:hypothetical protein